ncbi:mycoredoxin [Corynebacterium sp. HS2168-gen11]|uniref:mycoredoxin n=1 Tax=Corynebacterium sp. HS2168-gen11 TaxID=2974027 RepID=UPI00216B5749|nr:mycoredoxin [Corynebacterium sp. HS2168-gen11]MCS4536423.1 mycoredoxin [Corynebacterium sp. HS2168-gen11]
MSKEHITIHLTSWCPFCQRLVADLERENIAFTSIDVDNDAEAAKWVTSVNNGNRVVPTVLYSDGTHATNPPAAAVIAKLQELQA